MQTTIDQHITDYQHWREQLVQTISDYRSWLSTNGESDMVQDLRLYDMEESIRKDRLILAFVAEFSRGKTETINALFFSDYNQRLLPSDPGRTTMCPSELFWNDQDEPCIKLLPIETRKRDDSLAYLKSHQNQWVKLRLDIDSATSMRETLRALAQQKEVSLDDARAMGLWDDTDPVMKHALESKGKVDIPVWRHALINFPHPLLSKGLVILDTPGLNALGTEPELTLNIIPNSHAIIFLLATDTGVTKSDMQIWKQYIQNRANCKIAVLNKIDMLWDPMKTEAEIEATIQSQSETTAQQLDLPTSSVIAISAQKALVARIKKDPELLQRSGISKIEQMIAESVIPAKHEILRKTVISEIGSLVKVSRKNLQHRLLSTRDQLVELQGVQNKGKDAIQAMLTNVTAEKKMHEASVTTFTQGSQKISKLGKQLLEHLSEQHLNVLMEQSRQEIGGSWTTTGLNRSIKKMALQTAELANTLTTLGQDIQILAHEIYTLFHKQHGYDALSPSLLDMSQFADKMQSLEKLTEEFCVNPVNVMTEKHFLVKKFFHSLGRQIEETFKQAHRDAEHWLQNILRPLKLQIEDHKATLDSRMESLMQAHKNSNSLQKNIGEIEREMQNLKNQAGKLDSLLLNLVKANKTVTLSQDKAVAATTADV